MQTIVNKDARYQLVQKLASYFKVKKDSLMEEADNPTNPLIDFPSLSELAGLNVSFYCTQIITKLNLIDLLYYKKFIKSSIYAQWLNATSTNNSGTVVMTIHIAGTLWLVREGNTTIGGIVVEGDGESFVIEPIKNWLQHYYPWENQDESD